MWRSLETFTRGWWPTAHVELRATSDEEEVLGFPLPAPLVADLAQVDLLELEQRPASRALLLESNSRAEQKPFSERLASLGVNVQYQRAPMPHLWLWAEDFGRVHVPHKMLQAMVSWVSETRA